MKQMMKAHLYFGTVKTLHVGSVKTFTSWRIIVVVNLFTDQMRGVFDVNWKICLLRGREITTSHAWYL
jgi:hypothetical protein